MASENEFLQEVYALWCALVDQLGENSDLSMSSEKQDLLCRLTERAKTVSYLKNPEFIQRIRQQRDIDPPSTLSWGSVPALRFGPRSSIRPFSSAILPTSISECRALLIASVTDEEQLAALVMYTVIIRSCCGHGQVTKTYELPAFNPARTETYSWGQLIEEGNNGSNYGVLNHPDRRVLAAKVCSPNDLPVSLAQKREDHFLRSLDHPNLVRFIASHHQGVELQVYTEYVSGGTIAGMVTALGPMPEEETRAVIKQVLAGLVYLHDMEIVHGGINSDNLLITMDGVVKIADLGMAKLSFPQEVQAMHRALPWMSPEVLRESAYGPRTDVWNIGCVILEMHLGSNPWTRMPVSDMVTQIAEAQWPPIDRPLSKDLQATLDKVFVVTSKRISSAEMLMEKWVKGEADH